MFVRGCRSVFIRLCYNVFVTVLTIEKTMGKIIFHLSDLKVGEKFFTTRGNVVERKTIREIHVTGTMEAEGTFLVSAWFPFF